MQQDQIALASRGDKEAQEEFVRTYYSYVMGFLIKLTMHRELAEDLTQETFIKALRALKTYRGDSAPGSWLIAIAQNIFRDHIRVASKKQTYALEGMHVSDDGFGSMQMEMSAQAHEAMERLRTLSPENRTMIVLRHYYGYTSKDISRIMNIPAGTIRSRIHYALKSIKGGGQE